MGVGYIYLAWRCQDLIFRGAEGKPYYPAKQLDMKESAAISAN
jgi:hypothetical protein